MKFKREYCFGGLSGKASEDDFVVGYQADSGEYIKCEFSISTNRAVSYSVYKSRKEYENDCKYIRAFDKLAEAKDFCR